MIYVESQTSQTMFVGVPRYHKLDFPNFYGKEDPLGRLTRCDQFFRGQLKGKCALGLFLVYFGN
jgi:hypothetical protein